ncbi:unnamed protein product [Orchesella dallaii]|uniref:Uncharacterized protein n=1 Tax=Orchesella dallaii TaxID=48710 RepID=A0ABP1R6Q5_9HEXA
MKIMGNNLFDHHHLLKLSAFRKRNGKSMQSISSAPGLGYNNDEMQQAKRLASFVNSIHVTGLGISSGTANKSNEFTINVDTFDYDNLTFDLHQMSSNGLIIVGMAHEMTEVEDYVKICYEVENPGQYIMDIKYLGLHVPASPFKIDVSWSE